jgi:restriction system protein
LLERVKGASPRFFERLVVQLVVAMGYGSIEEAGKALGKPGDEGIDGIIKEDRLGLDVIYLQAKRWERTIGRPDIQQFAGALQGQRRGRACSLRPPRTARTQTNVPTGSTPGSF